jgi:putative membrane protein
MKKTLVALAFAVPALALADPPSADAERQTEAPPANGQTHRPTDESGSGSTGMTNETGKEQHAQGSTMVTDKDKETLAKLHHINQMEIKAGQMAKKNSQNKQVKQYGEMLIKDHSLADKQITALAKKENIELTMPAPTDPSEQAERQSDMDAMSRLETLKGEEFDREFSKMMVEGHQKAIDMVQTAVRQTQDSKIQGLLNKLLPVLKEHLRVAEQISKKSA